MGRKQAPPNVSFFAFQDIITSVVGIFSLIMIIMLLELANRTADGQSSGQQSSAAQSAVLTAMQSEMTTLKTRLEELKRVASSLGTSKPMTAEEKKIAIQKQSTEIEARLKQFEALQEKTSRAVTAAETMLTQLQNEALRQNEKGDESKKLLDKLAFLKAELDSLKDDDPLIFRNEQLQGKSIVVIDFDSTETRVLEFASSRRQIFAGKDRVKQFTSWADTQNFTNSHFLLMVRPGGNGPYGNARTYFQGKNASYGYDVIGANRPLKMRSEIGVQ
jgi:seryl-tRNA synthetase